ncbi:hypothetical protein L6654_24200 [Bradyrhizobium sp. WYCCWR 13023]|uniref:Uncharacterized protein n=1 Tax=Bradyrhizobium zhengyangense TaxID=2911009 RepID=A0A9X1U925_9BRAD|nr:hypothetical protein [Bradyrhizobium zhengyangense]MCG2629730.1 hypothetical protein [Bradyrhizobium zhengyangense]
MLDLDFDDLLVPADDDGPSSGSDNVTCGGLIVPSRAPNGQVLNLEAEAYRAAGSLNGLVVFVEADPETGEDVFSNAREFADAMGLVSLPTQEQASMWLRQRLSEALSGWEERLGAAWSEAEARTPRSAKPSPVPEIRERPKWSTGRDRGQKR